MTFYRVCRVLFFALMIANVACPPVAQAIEAPAELTTPAPAEDEYPDFPKKSVTYRLARKKLLKLAKDFRSVGASNPQMDS